MPHVGSVVLYRAKLADSRGVVRMFQYPAMVTSIETLPTEKTALTVNLTVFFDHQVQLASTTYLGSPTAVPFSEDVKEGTWGWPMVNVEQWKNVVGSKGDADVTPNVAAKPKNRPAKRKK